MPSLKEHPHKYTLDLFRISLDRMPVTVPAEIRDKAHAAFEVLAENLNASAEQIDAEIIRVGKATWPYRKSYEELYVKYGKARENELFLEELRPDVRESYLKWNKAGHSVSDARAGGLFEKDFGPEEKFAIEEAYLNAEEAARGELDAMVQGEKKDEYEKLFLTWKARQDELDGKIQKLRELATRSPKWTAEISDKVKTFEEGWNVVDRDPDEYEVEKELEYWHGVLDVEEGGV